MKTNPKNAAPPSEVLRWSLWTRNQVGALVALAGLVGSVLHPRSSLYH